MFWQKKKQTNPEHLRRHKRMQADYLMSFKPLGSTHEPTFVNATDISATGLRFLSDQFFLEGTLLDISIAIPPLQRTLHINAEVIRIRPAERFEGLYYISVRYLKVDPRDQAVLNEFIERLALTKGAEFMIDQFKEHWRKPTWNEAKHDR